MQSTQFHLHPGLYRGLLGSPLLARLAPVALSAWALVEFGDITTAIAEGRPGAWMTIGTVVVVLISALVSSIAGFAFSALAGCALAYFKMDPASAVRTIVVCSLAIQLYAVWKLRASIRWRRIWPFILGGASTLPVGVWLLLRLDASMFAAGLGGFLLGYGAYSLMRRETRVVRGGHWTAAVAGALGGLTGGLAGLPGPMVTIWCSMRGWDKHQQRAVYQPYILVMQALTLVCLRWQAPTVVQATQDLTFVPFALFGAIGGLALFQRLSQRNFHAATSALLLISGAGLLARAL
jgi:uncharacterized membrane protein YfcA